MKRNVSFEAFRVIFSIYMIVHHLDCFTGVDIPNFTQNIKKICFEGFVGVNFFFMLSGLGLVLGYKDKLDSKQITQTDFLYSRFIKIYPAYLFFFISAIFLYSYGSIGHIYMFLLHLFMLQTFAITSTQNIAFMYNGVAWCVSVTMFFYLVFCKIHKISYKECLVYICFLFMVVVVNVVYHNDNTSVMNALFYTNPFFRLLDFLIGIAIGLYFCEHSMKTESTKIQLLSVLLYIVFVLGGAYMNIPWLYKWSLYYIFPNALLLFAFYEETKLSKKLFEYKYWSILAKDSQIIYLSHQLLLNVIRIYFPISKFPKIYEFFFISVLIMIAFIIIFSHFFNKYVNQPFIKFISKKYKG